MKRLVKVLKWTGITLVTVIVILAVVVMSRQNLTYDAPFPDVHASTDSAVIAKGEYLFYGPAHCMDCHGNRDEVPEETDVRKMKPSGGFVFNLPIGTILVPNITSDKKTGIGNLSDGAIARTLRYGVGSDGRAIIDFMPFHNTSDEDLTAIISFLRTVPAIKKEVPRPEFNVIGKIVNAFLITPVGPDTVVPKSVTPGANAEYGKYLANSVANCRGCHTNRDMMTGAYIGEDFGGGLKIDVDGKPGVFVVSRNLTPDPETGNIYSWTEEQFINRFRAGKLIQESVMPWEPFKHMSDDDLKAIYMYLKTVKPVKNDTGPVLVVENK